MKDDDNTLQDLTFNEGWWAHAAGWPLYDGHTGAYRRGWLARHKYTEGEDKQ